MRRMSSGHQPAVMGKPRKPRWLLWLLNWMWPQAAWKRWQHWIGLLSAAALVYSLQYGRHEFGVGFSKDDPVKVTEVLVLYLERP